MKKNRGFTMIEVLVVIVILGTLGFIFTDILTQVLRGQNKIDVVSQVKENGQTVLDKLSNEIRQAERVICVNSRAGSALQGDTMVLFGQGAYIQFRLVAPVNGANGKITRDDFTADNILNPPPGTDTANDNQLCTSTTSFGSVNTITNTDLVNGVSVTGDGSLPVFALNSLPGYAETVDIRFRVLQGVNAGKTPESEAGEDGILFTTTAQVKGGK